MSSAQTLAGPPSDHCFKTVQHNGTPVGRTITIGDLETYVSEPTLVGKDNEPKNIILFLADVWGPFFINNQLLQDYFASQGFLVLGPDYFLGDPMHIHLDQEGFDRIAWFENAVQQAKAIFPKWLECIKEEYGTMNTKYFAVGYSFGAPFTLELDSTSLLSASAVVHPVSLKEDHFRQVQSPLLLSCAEDDFTFQVDARRRAEDILVEKKAVYHIQVFSGVEHGFAVRCNLDVENERWAKEESARSVAGWFLRFSK